MTSFAIFAKYYDLLYKDKDYGREALFILENINNKNPLTKTILDLGCGTGMHAIEFAKKGINVTAVDMSEKMIKIAKQNCSRESFSINFEIGDIRSWRGDAKYDAVTSLFHVVSYQLTNADLKAAMLTASLHLNIGGYFFFDFWYGPAVLRNPPEVRLKRMSNDEIDVLRLAEPKQDFARNTVKVEYEIIVSTKSDGKITRIKESHELRYLFLPEIEDLAAQSGLAVVNSGAWMNSNCANENCWFAWVLCKKT